MKLPYRFDPKARCPRFVRFLYRVLEIDPETQHHRRPRDRRFRLLQEWFGYNLLNDGRFQRFLIMVGDGSNGKSVILHLLTMLLGRENVCHVALDQLGGTFGLEPLLGKTANICGDLNEIDAVAEGILKRLTGQDNLTVHRKHKTSVTMAPAIKLTFATNTVPRFNDKTRGVWRRLTLMPYNVVIPDAEQDETLNQTLEAELPGILNWSIRGLQRLLEQEAFTVCPTCEAAKGQHQRDCDPFAQFVDESLELRAEAQIDKPELYKLYQSWCTNNGNKALACGSFVRRVGELRGVEKNRHPEIDRQTRRREYFFTGVGKARARPTAEDEE